MSLRKIPGNPQVDAIRVRLAIAAASGGLPGGTGAVVVTAGAGSAANGSAGTVLTANASGAPSFQSPIIPPQPIGPVAFIDPANSTGFASDANTGATANNVPPGSGPILTTPHLNDLLFNRKLTANRTITYMSDDDSGNPLRYDTVATNDFTLTFQGTPTTLHTGGTFNAGTVTISPTTNQRQLVHTSDLATFNPYVFSGNGGASVDPTYVIDTNAASLQFGTTAWIVSGVATASASRPIESAANFFAPGSFTIGDTYAIQRGSHLTLDIMNMPTGLATGATGFTSVLFNDFAFTATSVGSPAASYFRCSFTNSLVGGGSYFHCYAGSGIIEGLVPNPGISMPAGVLLTTVNDTLTSLLTLASDTYVTGVGLILGTDFYASVFISDGGGAGGSGVQCQDCAAGTLAGLTFLTDVFGASSGLGPGLVWGSGNHFGVLVYPGATGVLPGSGLNIPTVTGTAGDFAFQGQEGVGPITVARAWDDSVGAFTEAGGAATRTTTWAHLVAAIGAGGFNFNAQNPATNAAMVLA